MTDPTRTRRPGPRAAVGIALAATMLTTAGVAAQSPSTTTTPDATPAPPQTVERPDTSGRRGFDQAGPGRGFGGPGQEGRGFGHGFDGGSLGPGARGDRLGSMVTVASIDGTSLGLATDDGWTRTIDTTGVVLTRDGATIAISDILVGEPVRVVQTRNADGTYTVTGIEVQPSVASGTVGTASTDGFTVVMEDGTTTTVSVTPETTWWARGVDPVSIADATAGRPVAVEGQLQADGTIVATRVILG
jgi:hypothetical protein